MLDTLFATHYGVALIVWIILAIFFIGACVIDVFEENDLK